MPTTSPKANAAPASVIQAARIQPGRMQRPEAVGCATAIPSAGLCPARLTGDRLRPSSRGLAALLRDASDRALPLPLR